MFRLSWERRWDNLMKPGCEEGMVGLARSVVVVLEEEPSIFAILEGVESGRGGVRGFFILRRGRSCFGSFEEFV